MRNAPFPCFSKWQRRFSLWSPKPQKLTCLGLNVVEYYHTSCWNKFTITLKDRFHQKIERTISIIAINIVELRQQDCWIAFNLIGWENVLVTAINQFPSNFLRVVIGWPGLCFCYVKLLCFSSLILSCQANIEAREANHCWLIMYAFDDAISLATPLLLVKTTLIFNEIWRCLSSLCLQMRLPINNVKYYK